jgi:hypothetical protein
VNALSGIAVLEFASYIGGPYAGMMLSDLCAENSQDGIARWPAAAILFVVRRGAGRMMLPQLTPD